MDEGTFLFLEPEEADVFNRDSPGVLVLAEVTAEHADSPDKILGRVMEGPPQDRMFRKEDLESREEDIDITPAALKLAQEKDIDLSKVKGTGTDGKIILADIKGLLE
jgi:pyruvate/2-oxoglutarate dehydrogenase complex dihydrolipoamide acyltransferase (E2) component